MAVYLSLDIGGTKIAASALTAAGDLLRKRRSPTAAAEGPDRVIERALSLCHEAMEGLGSPERAGVGIAGPLDPIAGIVDHPPNLPGWDRVPLRARLAAGLGIDETRVSIENDANAGALAELLFGAARGQAHAVFLTMSTGIGGGLILDGRLYRGAAFNAGEIGHQIVVPGGPSCGCGNRGCLEAVASGSGIAARLAESFERLPASIRALAGGPDRVTARHLIEAARQGDGWAIGFLEETARLLARGIANLVFILNPGIVILGTLGYQAGDLLLEPVRAEVRRLCWPVLTRGLAIVASPLGPRLEELSGLAVALEADDPDNRSPRRGSCPPPLPSP